ncbi:MAG: AAA-like domain-containing protein [Lachnospiraceae bacterium]|nr:AAA-like domain-containing protein [Lachnospiraceae bacterium]
MAKRFNVNGACDPNRHYMVNLDSRLKVIREMVELGEYFTINRARQYGKTTTLRALAKYLESEYEVVSLDFQTMDTDCFQSIPAFVAAFANELLDNVVSFPDEIEEKLKKFRKKQEEQYSLQDLFRVLKIWCQKADREIVLLIDEVDTATNNQVFLDFLSQLRAYYLKRPDVAAFHSVILAGVYDVRSIKRKIRPEEEHKTNSPWNIAADFDVDMSFGVEDITNMLEQYENDYHTGMNVQEISELIYNYTSGYPVLVSRICKLLDEKISGTDEFPDRSRAWTKEGFYEAEKRIVREDNPLYESLMGKLETYPELREVVYKLLFNGKTIPYVATSPYIKDAAMFGFIRNENERAVISNRIFEAVLYNNFISEEFVTNKMYDAGERERNQFFVGGHLDIRRILEKFIETFEELYSQEDDSFLENVGRKYFLLFLKPIINGIGNYSIEPQTRNSERMDLVIFYKGEQNILELKLWRGNAYNKRGENQLSGYLDYFHLKKGYMLSFNFNKNKKPGIQEIVLGDRLLIEAVV